MRLACNPAGRDGYVTEYVLSLTAAGTKAGGRRWAQKPEARASWHYLVDRCGEVDGYVGVWDTAIANGTGAGAISPWVLENPGTNCPRVTVSDRGRAVRAEGVAETLVRRPLSH